MNLKEKLEIYKKKEPEIVFEWNDSLTEAKGWVVINSLRNGAAGGGTRMRQGLNKEEVVSLAKVMEVKFSVCGPPIGGAKSGINFNPNDPRKHGVLERWYAAVFPLLKNYYGTGGDLNVDELKDVIPITEDLGLWHPQEGIVNGHLKSSKGDKINLIGQLRYGCAKIVEDTDFAPKTHLKYAVADLITGFGVSESIVHFYQLFHHSNLVGKRVIIQGWGNVASAAGLYLARAGAKIVGIIDKNAGLINDNGFALEEIEQLFSKKMNNTLISDQLLDYEEVNAKIWDLHCDIFVPAAASKIVSRDQMERMVKGGLQVVSCGANVPFVDDEVFFGKTANEFDELIAIIPDFVANCGMARVFAYLMQDNAELSDKAIFSDVSRTIFDFLQKLEMFSSKPIQITNNALLMSIDKLL